jgi:hypothetical protein
LIVALPLPTEVVTINVTRTEVAQRGQRGGKPWVKYAVFGALPDGSPLPATGGPPFYTFDKLSVGPVDVTIEPYANNGLSVSSYTIKRVRPERTPKATRPAGGGDTAIARADIIDKDEVDDLRERVEALERSMARVMTKLRVEARS